MVRSVVLAPMGGLGNLLFQVAAGRHLAAEHGAELTVLPARTTREHEARALLSAALGRGLPETPPDLARRVARLGSRSRRRGIVEIAQKASQAFAPPKTSQPMAGVVVLRGYFQHPGFLGDQVRAVADLLRPWADAGGGRDDRSAIAVHLRRGDYVPRGWQLPPEYYAEAVMAVSSRVQNGGTVAIVADDRLAAEGLVGRLIGPAAERGLEVRVAGDGTVRGDFGVLAAAEHLVLSNSTFSWWAAVVGDSSPSVAADRMVVAPTEWLGSRDHALIRPGWVALDSGRRDAAPDGATRAR